MIVKIDAEELAKELAKVQVHEFYKRLKFLISGDGLEREEVESLYLKEQNLSEEALQIFNKEYKVIFDFIIKNKIDDDKV